MRLPLPGPADVISSAVAARDAVHAALDLVPRAVDAMGRVERLLDRAEAAVARVETVATSAGKAVERSHRTLDVAEIAARDAGRAVEGVNGLLDRVDVNLTTWEKPLRQLAPAAQRFADTLHPDEVEAAIGLVDRMPAVLDHLENDVLPMMRQLDRVGPDLHEILEIVEDLRRVVTGLPGVGLLRRRGNEEPPEVEGSVHEPDSRRR
ncbi:MAG: hypothetical protein ACRDV1_09635 [Actinomycetes bacterium]